MAKVTHVLLNGQCAPGQLAIKPVYLVYSEYTWYGRHLARQMTADHAGSQANRHYAITVDVVVG